MDAIDIARCSAPDFCDLPLGFRSPEFRIQWASGPWMRQQALALRRQVFCQEQGLFDGDDFDTIDADDPSCRLLVALSSWGAQPDEVIGTVRIHRPEPGLWWGSRLAVARDWRRHGQLGSSLIRLAVGSAHALGCHTFLAHVQAQNVALFRRLRWSVLDEMVIHDRMHALMRADLSHYPPCTTPYEGFVLADGARHG
ncbi:MSMEG_0567/Sll0786 family nitrogen starvation N-acetyltransferase [Xylophilus sp. GOD-11R]|uniref:MSMEG_0567/Sll0786 family nitrogen starvation N-acetyltransferase n=1 Tax=Xylophilus sp. GOD-11R TaxID=3089814 RepID=UPI00298CB890|nr:MSMEG_0567/Sll0786 family nitrogen starvation N-acetyltransferase [Xylophilus sp. GOD-11R]WPB55604.1 GNAT family N-acetyltransferase [Xylophilus sp. GOD-11R]